MDELEIIRNIIREHKGESVGNTFFDFSHFYYEFLKKKANTLGCRSLPNEADRITAVNDTLMGINRYRSFKNFILVQDDEVNIRNVRGYLTRLLRKSIWRLLNPKKRRECNFNDIAADYLENIPDSIDINTVIKTRDFIQLLEELINKIPNKYERFALSILLKNRIGGEKIRDLAVSTGHTENYISVAIHRATKSLKLMFRLEK